MLCVMRFMFNVFKKTILIFLSLSNLSSLLAGNDGGAIQRVGNYPDLLPEMPRYCCPLVI